MRESEAIRDSMISWISGFNQSNVDPLWFQRSSPEPFSKNDPMIKIRLNHFVNRINFSKRAVIIKSPSRILIKCVMINGSIEARVPDEISNLQDWKGSLQMEILSEPSPSSTDQPLMHGVSGINTKKLFAPADAGITFMEKLGRLQFVI